MELLQYTQELIAGFVYLAVGFRLSLLSVRTGRSVEWLLAASFILWGSSYFLYDIPYLLLEEPIALPFLFTALTAHDLGTFAFVLFTRKVFRSDERWAGWLVAAMTVALVAGRGSAALLGYWEGIFDVGNPWIWPGWLASTVPLVWMAVEGLLQRRGARRRQKLGLCDASTSHRFLLWGIAGSVWLLLEVVVLFQYMEYEVTQQWGGSLGMLVGFLEIVPIAAVWLVFFPPAFYRDWVRSSEAAAT